MKKNLGFRFLSNFKSIISSMFDDQFKRFGDFPEQSTRMLRQSLKMNLDMLSQKLGNQ